MKIVIGKRRKEYLKILLSKGADFSSESPDAERCLLPLSDDGLARPGPCQSYPGHNSYSQLWSLLTRC